MVVFSYVSRAAVKIDRKPGEEDEEKAVEAAWEPDMGVRKSIQIQWKEDFKLQCSITGHAPSADSGKLTEGVTYVRLPVARTRVCWWSG